MYRIVKAIKTRDPSRVMDIAISRLRSKAIGKRLGYDDFLIHRSTDWLDAKSIKVGVGFVAGKRCRIEIIREFAGVTYEPSLTFGDGVTLNDDVHIGCNNRITIGSHVLMASKIYISDHNHGSYAGEIHDSPLSPPNIRSLSGEPVVIEDNVWIGEMVSILPGVTIGKGAIIGSNSVVSRDIPAFCIAVGAPARAIKKFDFDSRRWIKIQENE